MQRPKMISIWDELFPSDCDFCDSNITDVLFKSETDGTFQLTFDVFPFEQSDVAKPKITKKLIAKNPFVFWRETKDFIVGQSIKKVMSYPEIVRLDIVTTGSLISLECDSYEVEIII